MRGMYFVICSNSKTCEQRVFCAFLRHDAEVFKDAFFEGLTDRSDWYAIIVRGVEE